jgi:hypothetical protein
MAPKNYLINLNKFLQEINCQTPKLSSSYYYKLMIFLKKLLPNALRVSLKKNKKIKKIYGSAIPFDTTNSKAFFMPTGIWMHGIYINDKKRFGGPIDEKDKKRISEDITNSFNSNPIALDHNLIAKLQPESTSSPHFPDVIIEGKDGYMTSNEGKTFLEKFIMPMGRIGLKDYLKTRCNLTVHGHHPIAVSVGQQWDIHNKARYGLVDIYEHILNRFGVSDLQ